ncbi:MULTISPECIES: DUF3263 domain-containing protein [Streptomyces]|uniref:DUF3263 domain-containing protein n=1 Tax=Streptomyces TaxID=1883 RepID=UPI0002D9BE1B|nr:MULTISPECIES: DUF3263 domain-containing protein [Streptomyces]MCC3655739.1 DUF3263 domain-containing protein [Streptomyces sp. S07_1.15]MZE80920.1 DUF3263 domain-containing protein [Streptomyces sp. SID5475]
MPHPSDPPEKKQPAPELGPREREILRLARTPFASPGPRDRAIREQLGMSPTAYFQILNALLDDERALAHDPVTVNRLRRIRERRRALREGQDPP